MLARAVSARTDVGAESAPAAPPRAPPRIGPPGTPPGRAPDARTRAPRRAAAAPLRPGRGGASARSPTSRLSSRRPSSDAERGGPLTGVPAEPSVQVVTLSLEVRVESDRALKLAQTLRLSADLEEDPADVRVRVRVCRVHREGPAVRGERFLVPLQPVGGDALVELGPQVIRVHLERLREPDERLLVVLLTHVEPADVVIRPREAGVDGDRLLVGIERVSRLVQAVLEPPPGDVERLRNFGDLASRDAVARHPSRLRAGLGTRPVLDTVQQDQPSEAHEPVVGDPGAERDETVSAVRLKQHREKAGGLGRNR